MPDPIKVPAAPAPAAAPAAPAITKPAAPTAPKVPAPAPKPSLRPPPSTRPQPKAMSAKKALGLDETPAASVKKVVEKTRAEIKLSTPTTAEYVAPEDVLVEEEPPAPAIVAPAAAAPVAPAAPAKIKVGGKEYTPEELEAALAPKAPAPTRQEPPAPPTPKPPTAEQIAAREAEFLETTAAALDVPFTEADMDTILAGGKESVAVMTAMMKKLGANAILAARKGVAAGLNPVMEQLFAAMQPLVNDHQSLQRYTVEQSFVAKYPDFVPHGNTAKSVAEELAKLYPNEVAKMSNDQFIDEVARQTDIILTNEHKRWFPTGNGNWRAPTAGAAAPPVAPVIAAPAENAPVIPAQPAANPTAPVAPRAKAPAVNAPAGAGTQTGKSFAKSVAGSMRG